MTKVPPDNILQQEHVPPAPPVQNMTDGAVSDATAQLWANASNRDSGWFAWAEANDQPTLLPNLVAASLEGTQDQMALAQGAEIQQPSCNLYPAAYALFPLGADGHEYFASRHLSVNDQFLFVITSANGPCSETIEYPDGTKKAVLEFTSSVRAFVPGTYRVDPMLGGIWYADGGGSCLDADSPPEWCGQ